MPHSYSLLLCSSLQARQLRLKPADSAVLIRRAPLARCILCARCIQRKAGCCHLLLLQGTVHPQQFWCRFALQEQHEQHPPSALQCHRCCLPCELGRAATRPPSVHLLGCWTLPQAAPGPSAQPCFTRACLSQQTMCRMAVCRALTKAQEMAIANIMWKCRVLWSGFIWQWQH